MQVPQVKLRREVLRAFWEAHFTRWIEGNLNQRECCEAQETNFAAHRRNFSQKAKEVIVLETMKPGPTVADVARRYQIAPRVLFRWRADLAIGFLEAELGFAAVSIFSEEVPQREEARS